MARTVTGALAAIKRYDGAAMLALFFAAGLGTSHFTANEAQARLSAQVR